MERIGEADVVMVRNPKTMERRTAGMTPQELVSIAVKAGCEVIEYDGHFCVRKTLDIDIVVTIPKVTVLVAQLVEKIKSALGL